MRIGPVGSTSDWARTRGLHGGLLHFILFLKLQTNSCWNCFWCLRQVFMACLNSFQNPISFGARYHWVVKEEASHLTGLHCGSTEHYMTVIILGQVPWYQGLPTFTSEHSPAQTTEVGS
jgi:hypothetical protein